MSCLERLLVRRGSSRASSVISTGLRSALAERARRARPGGWSRRHRDRAGAADAARRARRERGRRTHHEPGRCRDCHDLGCSTAHPFTAPAVRPRTSCFWKNDSRITSGSAAITAPANVTLTWSMLVARSCLQPDLDGTEPVVLGHEQRPQVLVPGDEEREHGQRGHRRAGERHGDPRQEAPVAVAVERGRVLQVARDR